MFEVTLNIYTHMAIFQTTWNVNIHCSLTDLLYLLEKKKRFRQPNIRFLVSDLLHVIRDVEVGVYFIFKSVGVHTADFAHFLAKWSRPGHEFSPSLKERSPWVNHGQV